MPSRILRVAAFVLLAAPLAAQDRRIEVGFSYGSDDGARRGALALWIPVVTRGERWHMSLGARASAYSGVAAGYTNRGTVSSSLPPSLSIDPAVTGVNVAVGAEFDLNPQVSLGANLDLAGFATGDTRDAAAGGGSAVPQRNSLFLWASNDRGALSSEFYGTIRFRDHLPVRVGLSHFVTNYIVTVPPKSTGSASGRYQRFETVPFFSVGWIR